MHICKSVYMECRGISPKVGDLPPRQGSTRLDKHIYVCRPGFVEWRHHLTNDQILNFF